MPRERYTRDDESEEDRRDSEKPKRYRARPSRSRRHEETEEPSGRYDRSPLPALTSTPSTDLPTRSRRPSELPRQSEAGRSVSFGQSPNPDLLSPNRVAPRSTQQGDDYLASQNPIRTSVSGSTSASGVRSPLRQITSGYGGEQSGGGTSSPYDNSATGSRRPTLQSTAMVRVDSNDARTREVDARLERLKSEKETLSRVQEVQTRATNLMKWSADLLNALPEHRKRMKRDLRQQFYEDKDGEIARLGKKYYWVDEHRLDWFAEQEGDSIEMDKKYVERVIQTAKKYLETGRDDLPSSNVTVTNTIRVQDDNRRDYTGFWVTALTDLRVAGETMKLELPIFFESEASAGMSAAAFRKMSRSGKK